MSDSWDHIGHANGVVAMAAINNKLFAATGDNRLWWRDPVGSDVSWDHIGHANGVVAMAAINNKLFAATGDNRLWWRDPVGSDVSWDHIGHANGVVAMAAINNKLFAATGDNRLWWRDPVGSDVSWDHIGHANGVVAMAAINNKLFAATGDNRLWWRDPVGSDVSWDHIGHANGVVAMAAINNKLFAATGENRLWWRDPVARTVLDDGMLVKEQSSPAVYAIFDTRRVWIPTPSALFAMGHSWDDVRVLPDGALAAFPEVRLASLSPTPGSLVFPPPSDPNPPHYGRHFVVPGVSNAIRLVSQGREVRIVELRGWLHPVPPGFLINTEDLWDDYHYELEVDSGWAIASGVDLNRVLKVGNILEHAMDATGPDSYRQISMPLVGIEINGWKPGTAVAAPKPDDWTFPQDGTPAGADFLAAHGLAETRWPFDPRFPVSEEHPPYTRVVGSLIADKEHGDKVAGNRAWRAGMPNETGEAPTRATEIHPPDLIELLPDPGRRETLRGVAVVAGTGVFESAEQELTARITPPGPRPSAEHGINVVELVGPETNMSTIVGGNEARTGALVQVSHYDARLWVKVRRTAIGGRPGCFKAVYRVFWDKPGLPRPTGWWSQSGTLSLNPPDRIDYTLSPNAVSSDAVEFALEAGPGITWRKVLNMADGQGNNWDIATQDHLTSARNGLYLHQLPNGRLAFWKAGFLGVMAHVVTLGDLDQLPPGTLVTFTWLAD